MIYKIYRKIARIIGETTGLGKIPILWHLNNRIRCLLKPTYVIRNSRIFYLDNLDSHNLSTNSIYEPESTAVVIAKVKEYDICVDVGANIGYYTDLFSQLVPYGKVFAFEPSEKTFNLLQKNCGFRHNVELEQCAIGDYFGKTVFYESYDMTINSTLPNPTRKEKAVNVNINRLDNLFDKIDFLKIDVEGTDIDVLRGAGHLLDNPNIKLLIEVTSKTAPDIFTFLEQRGFQCEILDWRHGFCNLYCER